MLIFTHFMDKLIDFVKFSCLQMSNKSINKFSSFLIIYPFWHVFYETVTVTALRAIVRRAHECVALVTTCDWRHDHLSDMVIKSGARFAGGPLYKPIQTFSCALLISYIAFACSIVFFLELLHLFMTILYLNFDTYFVNIGFSYSIIV